MTHYYTARVTIAAELDAKLNLGEQIHSLADAAKRSVTIDLSLEDGENIAGSGAVITGVEIDWETLERA